MEAHQGNDAVWRGVCITAWGQSTLERGTRLLRGFVLAACLMAAIAPASECARADEALLRTQQGAAPLARENAHQNAQAAKMDPSFRLLALEGRNVRWTMPEGGLPAVVTYAFVTSPVTFPGARNCDAMAAPETALKRSHIGLGDFRREVRAAFDAWEAAANITFRETASATDAGILIGSDAKARGRAFTNVALRDELAMGRDEHAPSTSGLGTIRQSLICLNPEKPWKIGFDGNLDVYDLRYTVMHEIGHAIGLDHPSPEGRLMSFRYVETTRGLTSGDAEGAVALYGRRGAPAAPSAPLPSRADATVAPGLSAARAFGLGERSASEGGR